jgi:hypothetical protein
MAQTAVEWLAEQIKEYDYAPITNTDEYAIVIPVWIFKYKVNEAIEMEKEQMIEFAKQWEARKHEGNLDSMEMLYNEMYNK